MADILQVSSSAKSILRRLRSAESLIDGCAFVTRDGVVVASEFDQGANSNRLGAMCATLLALAQRTVMEVKKGELAQLIVDGTSGLMIISPAGSGILAVVANRKVKLGLLILEAKKASKEFEKIETS